MSSGRLKVRAKPDTVTTSTGAAGTTAIPTKSILTTGNNSGSQQQASDEYAAISQKYVKSKQFVWRKHVEEYTAEKLLRRYIPQPLQHSSHQVRLLELACGAGHYTNKIVNDWQLSHGVMATDLSADMIALAKVNYPTTADFQVVDACCQQQLAELPFDVVFAAYLLNYCCDYNMLLAMCQTIKMNLNDETGVFITINDGSHQPPSTYTAINGFSKLLIDDKLLSDRQVATGGRPATANTIMTDFTPFTVVLSDPLDPAPVESRDSLQFTNFWISEVCLKQAFYQVGFKQVDILPVARSCSETDCGVCGSYVDNRVIMAIVAHC